jgi:eukaryotic-like serine/threonine-protein kinase
VRPGRRVDDSRTEIDRLPPVPSDRASHRFFDEALERPETTSRKRLADRYAIGPHISRVGRVFVGRDLILRRQVAVKWLRSNWARDALIRDRFARSALGLASIEHTHVVRVLDLVVAESALVMECVPGRTLEHAILENGRLEVRRALRIATHVCSGLNAAHVAGVVHGNLTAANVILCPDAERGEVAKLVGFELAPMTASIDEPSEALGHEPDSVERRHGARGDLRRVGQLLFFMLTGRTPCSGNADLTLLRNQLDGSVAAGAAARLTAVVQSALGLAPEHRLTSALELGRAMVRFASPTRRRRPLPSGAEAAAVVSRCWASLVSWEC